MVCTCYVVGMTTLEQEEGFILKCNCKQTTQAFVYLYSTNCLHVLRNVYFCCIIYLMVGWLEYNTLLIYLKLRFQSSVKRQDSFLDRFDRNKKIWFLFSSNFFYLNKRVYFQNIKKFYLTTVIKGLLIKDATFDAWQHLSSGVTSWTS